MSVTCKRLECTNPPDFLDISTPLPVVYYNTAQTYEAGCGNLELLTYNGSLPSWIGILSNNLVGAAGVYSAATQSEADANALAALNTFAAAAVSGGLLLCLGCSLDIRPIFETDQGGVNRDLAFQIVAGQTDASITYAYVAAPNLPLSILVTGNDVVVTLATNGASAIISSANDILNALQADALVTPILTVALASGSDGTGTVLALATLGLFSGASDAFDCQAEQTGVYTLPAAGQGWVGAWSGAVNLV